MGTKIGAWMMRFPFHKDGKLPLGLCIVVVLIKAPARRAGKSWKAGEPISAEGCSRFGMP